MAVRLIATGVPNRKTARRVGVSERTLATWVARRQFEREVREIWAEMDRCFSRKLKSLGNDSLAVLERYVRQGLERRASSRDCLLAARTVLMLAQDSRGGSAEQFDADESFL